MDVCRLGKMVANKTVTMNDSEQIQAFGREVDGLITRYSHEFDLTYAAVIGALTFRVHKLCIEAGFQAQTENP